MWKKVIVISAVGALLIMGCSKKEEQPSPTGIQGTIRPQAGFNIDVNNIRVQVYSGYDNETGFNGLVKEDAATGSAVEASYSIELAPGNYYVVAWKDMNNDHVLSENDIYGFYANDLGQPLAVTVVQGQMTTVDFTVYPYTGGGGGGGGGNGNTITGTASLAPGVTGDLSGAYASIYASAQDWSQDNYIARINVNGAGTTVNFTFNNVADGTYYLDIWKDNDGNGTWSNGDFAGVYGTLDPNTYQASLTPIAVSNGQTQTVNVTVYRLGG